MRRLSHAGERSGKAAWQPAARLTAWHTARQFGHLFAKGDTREAAIRAMVVALKEVKIRGEIRTIVDYAVEMIQSAEFVTNNIHTGWLDARIAQHVRPRALCHSRVRALGDRASCRGALAPAAVDCTRLCLGTRADARAACAGACR